MRILLVEDHVPLAENIGEYLTGRGMHVDFAYDGRMALHLASAGTYDALILDVSLPKLDGLAVARQLRAERGLTTPILMLTARDTLDDKLAGFAAGSDDYLTKPFELAELEVRLLALCRRGKGHLRQLRAGPFMLDLDTREVTRAGRVLKVTPTGFRILEALMRRAPGVVPRGELSALIWGESPPEGEAAMRVHIHALRAALDCPGRPTAIETLPGTGYRLVVADAA